MDKEDEDENEIILRNSFLGLRTHLATVCVQLGRWNNPGFRTSKQLFLKQANNWPGGEWNLEDES